MTNLVVLIGRLARPAQLRRLPSGDGIAEYQLTVAREGERAESVPVVWPSPPAAATAYDTDARVLVVGRVRRRFFRANARTESRTEVVAESVVPCRQAKRAQAALAGARERLEAASP